MVTGALKTKVEMQLLVFACMDVVMDSMRVLFLNSTGLILSTIQLSNVMMEMMSMEMVALECVNLRIQQEN
jgi:hypothetical protein